MEEQARRNAESRQETAKADPDNRHGKIENPFGSTGIHPTLSHKCVAFTRLLSISEMVQKLVVTDRVGLRLHGLTWIIQPSFVAMIPMPVLEPASKDAARKR